VIAEQDPAMTRATELLFVDPAVSDLAGLLGGLRLEVEAIVLDAGRPAALASRQALGAVHIVAHGSPGRISFAAGEWLAATHDASNRTISACMASSTSARWLVETAGRWSPVAGLEADMASSILRIGG